MATFSDLAQFFIGEGRKSPSIMTPAATARDRMLGRGQRGKLEAADLMELLGDPGLLLGGGGTAAAGLGGLGMAALRGAGRSAGQETGETASNLLLRGLMPRGVHQAVSRTGRRASQSGGQFLNPDIFDQAALKQAQPKTDLGKALLRREPNKVKQAILRDNADVDTMARVQQGMDEGAREALREQLQREAAGRGNTLPLWDDPTYGSATARWKAEEPGSIVEIPGDLAEEGMEGATAWHNKNTDQMFMSRQAQENIDPKAYNRIHLMRKRLGLPENPRNTGYHEGMHSAEVDADLRHPDLDAYLNENYLQTAALPTAQGGGPPIDDYYHWPPEVLALTNQFRKWHGIPPGEELSEDQIEQLVRKIQQQYEMIKGRFGADQYSLGSDLEHIRNFGRSYSPRKLAELIKYIPAAAGPTVPLMMRQQNRQRT